MRGSVGTCALAALAVVAAPLVLGGQASRQAGPREHFIQSFCVDCHGPEKQKGDFRIDDFAYDLSDAARRDQWDRVLEYVKLADMPPENAKRVPSESERQAFVAALAGDMRAADESAPIGRPALRRLNRDEYLNSLRDLAGRMDYRLPGAFPSEFNKLPFDTMPDGLSLAPALLDAYLDCALLFADEMVPLPERPIEKRGVEAGFIGVDLARKWTKPGAAAVYLTGANTSPWSGGIWVPETTARTAGMYRVRLRANAEGKVGADGRPLRISFHASNPGDYAIPRRALNSQHPRVAAVDVPHTEVGWIECLVPVEKDERIYAFCENRFAEAPLPFATGAQINAMVAAAKKSEAPTIRVEAMEVEGPVAPLPRQIAFLRDQEPVAERKYLGAVLLPFAERAFRRPLSQAEGESLLDDVWRHLSTGGSEKRGSPHALHYGIRRILTSPAFLHLEFQPEAGELHHLGARLAYFLWSGPPDQRLRELAATHRLADTATLAGEVARMIADPRSAQFVSRFSGQWLGTRRVANLMVCDVRYQWGQMMRHGMIRSTERFFEEILLENLPIATFIDSDFIYASEPMLESWGLPVEQPMRRHEANFNQFMAHPEIKRIKLGDLDATAHRKMGVRGGVIGLPSVLAATGDGVDSSPILRGVWVLENVFGMPVPPPPPNVPAIAVDTSQATSVRETLAAHTENASCFKCHRHIDPVGLALENYDAIGGWRSRYQAIYSGPPAAPGAAGAGETSAWSRPIDPAGQLPGGVRLNGPQDIKDYLMANRQRFTRGLTTKLFEYGAGRLPTVGDRRGIDRIVAAEPKAGYGLRDLILAVVQSEAFRAQ